MANILDYLDWRGDLLFSQDPFNEVDNLILAELVFLDFTGIVPGGQQRRRSVPLYRAAQEYFARTGGKEVDLGVLVPDEIPELFRKAAASPRFRNVKLNCFTTITDYEKEEQFAALTVELGEGSIYLAFRGTDDTIVGWKEDFNMSFHYTVPSQQEALAYTQQVAALYPRMTLRLGGHSKGGNLAVYSALYAPEKVQRRIVEVYNNDGPGFTEDVLSRPEHQRISSRLHTIVPDTSTVGMLLEHDEDYQVVQSSQSGLFQHDGFSWQVRGRGFVHLEDLSWEGQVRRKALKSWLGQMDHTQREVFTETLFSILTAGDAKTLKELQEDGLRGMLSMWKTAKNLDKETRDILLETLKQLLVQGARSVGEDLSADLKKYFPKAAKDQGTEE